MKQAKFIALMALVIALIFVALVGKAWYGYVTNTDSPYDEVGIDLNSHMPYSMRKWGCDKLHANFKNALPPYGCSEDGKNWL